MQLTKMKLLYIVSNIFPTILHIRFYSSPSLLTTLPPIYILSITPCFHLFYIQLYSFNNKLVPEQCTGERNPLY